MASRFWANTFLLAMAASTVVAVSGNSVCHDEPAPNSVVNPGFDDGLSSWQINSGYVSGGVQKDGTVGNYYVMPGSQTIRTNLQNIRLVAGTAYTLSVDFQSYLDNSAAVSFKSCIVGIVTIDNAGSRTVVSGQRTITKTSTDWETIPGVYTPSSDSVTFELAASCAGSTTSALQLRWDNTRVERGAVQVCVTSTPDPTPDPTSTSSSEVLSSASSSTTPPITPSSAPSTTPTNIPSTISDLSATPSTTPVSVSPDIPLSTPSTTPTISASMTPTNTSTRPSSPLNTSPASSLINSFIPTPTTTRKPCKKRRPALQARAELRARIEV